MRHIYIITSDPRTLKVGIAADPKRRLRGLQTGSPVKLALYATFPVADDALAFAIEAAVHRRLAAFALQGKWFAVDPAEVVAVITAVISGGPPKIDRQGSWGITRGPMVLVCPKCRHDAVTTLTKPEVWRKAFRCKRCKTRTEGRRFFIRRVA